jgi:predicted dehydrogenase
MAKTLRVGMIGYGFMGKAHSNAWRQAPFFFPLKARIELHSLCGRNSAGVQAARAKLGWQVASTDWRELVESPLIDIVDITSHNNSHAEIAIAAAQAGKHVLCEKPLALNVKQAQAMLAAVQKAKVMHMVCHNYRRIPAIALAKKMIVEGALGQIYHFYGRYAQDWLVDPETPLCWKLDKSGSGSGAHSDIGVHLIDLARYLVGDFKEVCGQMHTFTKERPLPEDPSAPPDKPAPKPKPAKAKAKPSKPAKTSVAPPEPPRPMGKVDVDDATAFLGAFANGALANIEATRNASGRKNHMALEINGSRGSLFFDFEDMNRLKYCENAGLLDRQGFRDILVLQPGGAHPYVNHWWRAGHLLGYEHTFVHTVADFVNACVDLKLIHPTFEDGLQNQRVLEAVEESAKKRAWVKL